MHSTGGTVPASSVTIAGNPAGRAEANRQALVCRACAGDSRRRHWLRPEFSRHRIDAASRTTVTSDGQRAYRAPVDAPVAPLSWRHPYRPEFRILTRQAAAPRCVPAEFAESMYWRRHRVARSLDDRQRQRSSRAVGHRRHVRRRRISTRGRQRLRHAAPRHGCRNDVGGLARPARCGEAASACSP